MAPDGKSTLTCNPETYKCSFMEGDPPNSHWNEFKLFEPENNRFFYWNRASEGFLSVSHDGSIRSDNFDRKRLYGFSSPVGAYEL